MKKKILSAVIAAMVIGQAGAVNLVVDSVPLKPDVPPTVIDGRTLVPVRAIFEALGAEVEWDDATNTAKAIKGAKTVTVQIGSTTAYVDGAAKTLDVPAQTIDDRTMVPARFVSEAFGADVKWDGATETVTITTSKETGASNQSEFRPLEIKEYGYAMNGEYLYCAVNLYNPNSSYCVEFPRFRITARDDNGFIIGTTDQVLSVIYPHQNFYYAGLSFKADSVPASVSVEVVTPDTYNIKSPDLLDHSDYSPLNVINSSLRGDRVTGEVVNQNGYDIDSAIVTVIFKDKDGKITAGQSTFVKKIPAGGSVPFDASVSKRLLADSYEVYANIW